LSKALLLVLDIAYFKLRRFDIAKEFFYKLQFENKYFVISDLY